MATQSFPIKTGATLALAGTVSLPAGAWTATSEVKDQSGNLVSTLNVTLTAPTAPSTIWVIQISQTAENTLTWPLGPLNCDIRYVDSSDNVIYTPTFQFQVSQEITNG